MKNRDDFDFLIHELFDAAVREFKATEQYRLLQEKVRRMERECEDMFTRDEKNFAEECFDLISEVDGWEELYVYRKGMLDGVSILRQLGALD